MATKAESRVVYGAGLVQGIVMVTFPAASTIFTDPDEYGLSSSAYGALFLPMALAAIASSLVGAGLSRRFGARRLYFAGLAADFLSMALLFVSRSYAGESSAYVLLLLATTCLGIGFGLAVPAMNTLTAAFHPARVDASILTLNAVLGLGTALAPVVVAVFVGLGFWWGLPLTSAVLLAIVFAISLALPLRIEPRRADRAGTGSGIPSRFWIFAAFATLYGICETMNGNWASLDMTKELGASASVGSLVLTAFWAMVTVGRILFSLIRGWFPTRRTYRLLPFVLVVAFVATAMLPSGESLPAVLAFGLAGLGCSALLPLTISFGQEELASISASVAGGVIAFYQFGYGIAAFGVGPLEDAGVALPTIFGFTAVVAAAMGGLSFVVARRRPEPISLHPRPAEHAHAHPM